MNKGNFLTSIVLGTVGICGSVSDVCCMKDSYVNQNTNITELSNVKSSIVKKKQLKQDKKQADIGNQTKPNSNKKGTGKTNNTNQQDESIKQVQSLQQQSMINIVESDISEENKLRHNEYHTEIVEQSQSHEQKQQSNDTQQIQSPQQKSNNTNENAVLESKTISIAVGNDCYATNKSLSISDLSNKSMLPQKILNDTHKPLIETVAFGDDFWNFKECKPIIRSQNTNTFSITESSVDDFDSIYDCDFDKLTNDAQNIYINCSKNEYIKEIREKCIVNANRLNEEQKKEFLSTISDLIIINLQKCKNDENTLRQIVKSAKRFIKDFPNYLEDIQDTCMAHDIEYYIHLAINDVNRSNRNIKIDITANDLL